VAEQIESSFWTMVRFRPSQRLRADALPPHSCDEHPRFSRSGLGITEPEME